MALPSPSFYSTGDEEKTYKDFGSCEAGAYIGVRLGPAR